MLNKTLQFVNDILDQFIKNRFGLDESKVLLNNLIESNGSVPQINQNKVILSMINVEKETNRPFYDWNKKSGNENYSDVSPYERFNIDILISSNFDDYAETLRYLNEVLVFFQVHPRIKADDFSSMPAGVDKLDFEIEKINYVQMQGLWTSMGAKYVPSVIYKMRLVTMQGNEADAFVPAISQTSNMVTA
jgi:hypothetical protein